MRTTNQHGMPLGSFRQLAPRVSMPTVKCRDCGCLAVSDRYKQGAFEASDLVRDKGCQINSRGIQVIASTFCAARKMELKATQSGLLADVVAEINQEIECGGFRQWERGKSPEKHAAMGYGELMQAEVRALREETERREERRHREILEWQQQVEKNVGRRHEMNLVAAFLTAIVGGIVVLIGAKLIPWFH